MTQVAHNLYLYIKIHMSDNTVVCIVTSIFIAGCTTCSVSDDRMDIEELRIEHDHKIELLEAQLKQTAPKP